MRKSEKNVDIKLKKGNMNKCCVVKPDSFGSTENTTELQGLNGDFLLPHTHFLAKITTWNSRANRFSEELSFAMLNKQSEKQQQRDSHLLPPAEGCSVVFFFV